MARIARLLAINAVILAVGVLLVEIGLRLFYPVSLMNVETPKASGEELVVPDETLGIRPALGTFLYDSNGIRFDHSVESKASDPYKILFIGDSVTGRGRIVDAFPHALPSERVSFLNGGVDGYNIQQEVEFFFRYQAGIKPQTIVHQMHINDLQPSTLVVRIRGSIRSYSPRMKPQQVNQWLYARSQLYRFFLLQVRARGTRDELLAGAEAALRRLRDYTRQNGIAYHVVLSPILLPYDRWSATDQATREDLLRVCRELGIDAVDLWPVAENLIGRGIAIQEPPGDIWHPNAAFGEAAAKYITEKIPSLAAAASGR